MLSQTNDGKKLIEDTMFALNIICEEVDSIATDFSNSPILSVAIPEEAKLLWAQKSKDFCVRENKIALENCFGLPLYYTL